MINEDAVKGMQDYADRLNAGEFDDTPAFTTGQVNKNGIVVPYAKPTGPPDLTGDIIAFELGELNDEETIALFQNLVDTGLAWQLQGSYGRTAVQLIEAGVVTRPTKS